MQVKASSVIAFFSSFLFVERYSGSGRDFVFNYIFPTLRVPYGSNCMRGIPTTNILPSLRVKENVILLPIGSCQLLGFARQHKGPKAVTLHRLEWEGLKTWDWEQNLDVYDNKKALEAVGACVENCSFKDKIKNNKHNSIENRKRNFFLFVLRAFTLENCYCTINKDI